MPDNKFYTRKGPFTLEHLAQIGGASIGENSDAAYKLDDVAPLDKAERSHLTFLDNPRYKDAARTTKAGACIVTPALASVLPAGTNLLLTKTPYLAYATICQAFYPVEPAKPGKDTLLENGAVIGAGAVIGDRTYIGPNAVIGENVRIGSDCHIGASAVISHAIIGDNVRIYPGVCIGQDGFGFAPGPAGHVKIPQLGRVIIGNNIEIGANSTIDRGSGPDTVIGDGTWIDNMVQVAHNVKIGKHCIIAAQCGISGSTVIEDFVAIGGQVGISGHLHIGKGARIAAKSGVTSNVPAGAEYMGYPARPMRQYLKGIALLNRLIKKEKSH